MKRISVFIAAVALTLCASAPSFGQNRQAVTAVIPSVTFEILDQLDSPLDISVDEKMAARFPGARLKFTNSGSSPVNAFILHIKGGTLDHSYMVFINGKGIAPGAFHIQGVSIPAVAENTGKATVAIDYVQFEDGRSWGADSLGKSKHVRSFLDGRDLAISRLKELLTGQEDSDFIKSLDAFRSSSFGEPVFPAGRSPRSLDYFAKGYGQIVDIVRRMPRRVDEAQELARKLELMPKSVTQ